MSPHHAKLSSPRQAAREHGEIAFVSKSTEHSAPELGRPTFRRGGGGRAVDGPSQCPTGLGAPAQPTRDASSAAS
jgi:hypothetical protein